MRPDHLVDELREPVAGVSERQDSHARSIASCWREVCTKSAPIERSRSGTCSVKIEDCPERLVDRCQFVPGEMADHVAESLGIDGGGLLDKDVGRLAMDFDLSAE